MNSVGVLVSKYDNLEIFNFTEFKLSSPSILKDLSFKIIEKFNKMDILEKCGGEKGGIFQY